MPKMLEEKLVIKNQQKLEEKIIVEEQEKLEKEKLEEYNSLIKI